MESDEFARLLLLQVTGGRAPAMLRAIPAWLRCGRHRCGDDAELTPWIGELPATASAGPPTVGSRCTRNAKAQGPQISLSQLTGNTGCP